MSNRLSENESVTVLALEAGDYGNNFTDIPALNVYSRLSKYDWSFSSIPQDTCCLAFQDKKCRYPSGRGVGGSTILGSQIYVRGNRRDFGKWASDGNLGWSYEDVLPYFKKAEKSFIYGDIGFHGFDGPLNVEYVGPLSPLYYTFIQANLERGRPFVDPNGEKQIGVCQTQFMVEGGKMKNTGKAYVIPALSRPNLQVSTDSYVTKILIDSKVANGVEFTKNGRIFRARTRKEVILCAGVIKSPHILMLSGIGPAEHLSSFNIPVVQNLKVGENLQCHPTFSMYFNTNVTDPLRTQKDNIRDYLRGVGDYTIAGNNQGETFYQTVFMQTNGLPDLEITFAPPRLPVQNVQKVFKYSEESFVLNLNPRSSFVLKLLYFKPISKGSVKLKSSDPFEYPSIDTNALSDPFNFDISAMYAHVKTALALVSSPAFKKVNASVVNYNVTNCLEFEIDSEEYWECLIRHLTLIFHPIGTCKMGPNPDEGAVVDNECRVYGIEKLRVVDASVLPFSFTGHTEANVVAMAERMADVIKSNL